MTLIIGNWKMNGTVEETLKMITELRHKLPAGGAEVAVAPPFTSLYSASVALQDTPIKLAAQNMHWETEGPYTGEISGAFLKDIGCTYVILGHSERRQHFGETDEAVNRKIRSALVQELIPVVCIGETLEQRKSDKTETVLESQMKKGFQGLLMGDVKNMAVAYEPVWAIGTGQTATVEEIEQAHRFIRDYLAKSYDAPTANGIRLLYGGSVTSENARPILQAKNVDGVLVGGASLVIEKFLKIVEAAEVKAAS
jgi:triosephosphate isomerase